ncbi:hypothetical protein CSC2_26940 [Clostridium zeae]|uniref:DUF1453 family protein n=1 Tax=Clostridium zeae TaxID=2759022 RepID=A0ABQ1EBH4_9CLOT|nr:CcdC protein domain-containing protein [Clostridium zeae]GFZ32168.1 hypothetical protein CSC2_26940 [Clostridium zeae]
MSGNQLTTIVIVIALSIYIISQQLGERKVRKLTFILIPLFAIYETYNFMPKSIIPSNQLVQVMLTVLVGFIAGVIQSKYTKIYYKENKLYMRGGKEALIAWISLVLFRFLIRTIFNGINTNTSFQASEWILYAGIAASFGFRSIFLYLKHPQIGEFFSKGGRTE